MSVREKASVRSSGGDGVEQRRVRFRYKKSHSQRRRTITLDV
ncbi:MAG: hypothetical protein ACREXR_05915 [Gammaproteobacteria bacterium]